MSAALKISLEHPFSSSNVLTSLTCGVDETLKIMAKAAVLFEKSFTEINWRSPTDISVYLEIQSLPSLGQIRFHFTSNVLGEVYKQMMGEEEAADMPLLIDCLGELANVCYGNVKSKLNSQGYALKMSLPHASKTADLPDILTRFPHIVIPFMIFNETCYIEIVIF